MYRYNIKVAVSEKWSWKCSACGNQNIAYNSTTVYGEANEAFDLWQKNNAKDRCVDNTNKKLNELYQEYYCVPPRDRRYDYLSLNLRCSRCGHREEWASPNAFTSPTITTEKRDRIRAMRDENLPTMLEHQFTPIPAEERRKRENKYVLIFVAVFVAIILLYNLSR